MSKLSDVNPTIAIIWFILSTIIYGIFKYFIGIIDIKKHIDFSIKNHYIDDTNDNNIKSKLEMLLYSYLLFIIISEFFINLSLTSTFCEGTPQYYNATFSTIIPWTLMFTTIIAILRLFPGWLAPFSNTFGYGLSVIMGIKDLFNKLIITNFDGLKSKTVKEALTYITTDNSILINEITIENFDDFWKNMSEIFVKQNITNEIKLELFNIVRAKTILSEVIWFLLTGLLVISISYNNIINSNCEKNLKDMKNI